MKKQDLENYKIALSKLSRIEQLERDIYLRKLANGELQGPPTGHSSIDKPWLKYYKEEAITETAPETSVYVNLKEANKNNLNKGAINYFNKKYSYAQLINKIDDVANAFIKMGIKEGDVVTLSLPNIPENVFCFYALNKIGAIANFIDLRLKGDKLINAINSTGSKVIVSTDIFSESLDEIIKQTSIKNTIIASPFDSLPFGLKQLANLKAKKISMKNGKFITWKEFENMGKNQDCKIDYQPNPEQKTCILHTSGTTGNPKGVVLTNRNFLEMAIQVKNSGLVYNNGDVFLSQVPPFLAYNILAATNNPLTIGLEIKMLPDYKPEKFAENVAKYKPNHVIAGPADWNNFLNNNKIKNKKFNFLVSMISGSDKIDESQKQEINNLLHEKGSKGEILEGYGMTEIGAAAVMNIPEHNVPNSVGIPLRNVNVCIYDNENNCELSYNQEGEICMSGPTVMAEYYNKANETNEIKKLHVDGKYWLHSGDVGYITEDGNLYLKGRMKRIIVRHDGIKVSPYDIEKVLISSDFVSDCCVVGIEDSEKGFGSVPIANVVLNDPDNVDSESIKEILKDLCGSQLGEKYLPKDIIIRSELPLTDVGKVDYRTIQKENEEYFKQNILKKVNN